MRPDKGVRVTGLGQQDLFLSLILVTLPALQHLSQGGACFLFSTAK